MALRRFLPAVFILAAATVSVAAQQSSLEYDVKAAFLLNFVRFVEWPSSRQQPPLRICVMQPSPFGDRLTALVSGELWNGRPIEVHVLADLRPVADCHLLYVPPAAESRFAANTALVGRQPTLTVGEHDTFLADGGMIHLFLEQNRVRFSINLQAADRVGLQISSRLLRLARNVIGVPRT